jgi:hypothetical protein
LTFQRENFFFIFAFQRKNFYFFDISVWEFLTF